MADDIYGVSPQRKEHPAIKSGKKELGDVPGSLGSAKVDGQRLYHGLGTSGMGSTPRRKETVGNMQSKGLGSFKIRKRLVKG